MEITFGWALKISYSILERLTSVELKIGMKSEWEENF